MLNRYTTTSAASRISWLHWVVSRKNRRMSLSTNSRLATGSGLSTQPAVRRNNRPRTNRSAPSCALVNPCANSRRCSIAPSVTRAAAVVQSNSNGRRSEEHTSELQSPCNLVCRLLLEKKKKRVLVHRLFLYLSHDSIPHLHRHSDRL